MPIEKKFHVESFHNVVELLDREYDIHNGQLVHNTNHIEQITIKRAGDGIVIEVAGTTRSREKR